MAIFTNPNYDFIKWRWHALAASTLLVVAGIVFMVARGGMPLGIDFTGGTIVVAKFSQAVETDRVRVALDGVPGEKVIQSYGDPADNAVPQLAQEDGTSLEKDALAVVGALKAAGLPAFEILSQEIVGPVIGRELQLKGVYATLASIVGIAIYIALRFRPAFAIGAIVATLHDVLVTLAFLAFFGYDLSLNIVAALLTITGYSVNDTIVIFDRVRENLRSMRRDSLKDVINTSINQTLGRTVLTAGTTLLSAIALFVAGGEVLRGFAFTLIVGVITGTYSSVFVAAAVVTFWRGAGPTRATADSEVAGTASSGGPQQPTRKARPQRKARAS